MMLNGPAYAQSNTKIRANCWGKQLGDRYLLWKHVISRYFHTIPENQSPLRSWKCNPASKYPLSSWRQGSCNPHPSSLFSCSKEFISLTSKSDLLEAEAYDLSMLKQETCLKWVGEHTRIFIWINHPLTGGERHPILIEAVEHEDGDVEEHDGWMLTMATYGYYTITILLPLNEASTWRNVGGLFLS